MTENVEELGIESVRIHAVLKLICASKTREGWMCRHRGDYERPEPDDAIAAARADGWTFRLRCARCPQCGRDGNSFPKVGKGYQRVTR